MQGLTPLHAACSARGQPAVLALLIQRCEFMQWSSQPQKTNLLDFNRNTPLHTCIKLAPNAAKYVPILIEHGSNPNLQNAQGQTVLHLLAERAVREQQQRTGVSEGNAAEVDDAEADGRPMFAASKILDNLAEVPLALDAAETETGNTALRALPRSRLACHYLLRPSPFHISLCLPSSDIAAFGGCIGLALKLVSLGGSVGLPNKDGFTPLDSMQPSGVEGKSLQARLSRRRHIDSCHWLTCNPLTRLSHACRSSCSSASPSRRVGPPTVSSQRAKTASCHLIGPTLTWQGSIIAAIAAAALVSNARLDGWSYISSYRRKRSGYVFCANASCSLVMLSSQPTKRVADDLVLSCGDGFMLYSWSAVRFLCFHISGPHTQTHCERNK